jgi:hypothetical protein
MVDFVHVQLGLKRRDVIARDTILSSENGLLM